MMPEDMSRNALEAHVQGFIDALRETLLRDGKPCNEEVIEALEETYRSGWNDADGMFRAWGMIH